MNTRLRQPIKQITFYNLLNIKKQRNTRGKEGKEEEEEYVLK